MSGKQTPNLSSPQGNYRYPGVTPFTTGQANVFFGRQQDTDDLHRLIRREPLVVLYGKSGLGKSSLLNAGIIPRCHKEGDYNPLAIRFGSFTEGSTNTPLKSVIFRLRGFVMGAGEGSVLGYQESDGRISVFGGLGPTSDTLEKIKPDNENSLWHHAKTCQLNGGGRPLLLFDQFEELFSYPEAQVRAFQEELSELLNTGIPLRFRRMAEASDTLSEEEEDLLEAPLDARIVFAIRSDRMHLLDRLKDYLPNVLRHCFELKALTKQDAKDAILLPARAKGDFQTAFFDYSPAALAQLLAFLEDEQDGRIEGILLQMLCEHYERRLVEAQGLTLLDLPQIGDPEQVVKKYYDEKIEGLPAGQRLPARRLIEDGLVSEGEAMRLTLHESYVAHEFGVDRALLERLVDSRLLRSEPFLRGGYTYELSHDRLVPPVLNARNLRREDEDRLEAERQKLELEKTRKRLRMVRGLLLVAVLALLVAGYFGYDANVQKKKALEQTEEAGRQRDKAEKALKDFQTEQAAKERLKFNDLERRANTILEANMCPKDLFQEMRDIAKTHPDSLIFKDNLKTLYAKNKACK